jgi:hypothetical protein
MIIYLMKAGLKMSTNTMEMEGEITQN